MFAVFHWLRGLKMKMHLLEPVYVPEIRLFQRYKTMNANTVTASNEPTMKYHCTVVLAEKTKRYLITMGQLKMKDPKQNKFVLYWGFIVLKTVFN